MRDHVDCCESDSHPRRHPRHAHRHSAHERRRAFLAENQRDRLDHPAILASLACVALRHETRFGDVDKVVRQRAERTGNKPKDGRLPRVDLVVALLAVENLFERRGRAKEHHLVPALSEHGGSNAAPERLRALSADDLDCAVERAFVLELRGIGAALLLQQSLDALGRSYDENSLAKTRKESAHNAAHDAEPAVSPRQQPK
eukprot:Amastigsp_a345100_6.p2 type:complete len:201 gc:universal Amastigsp_a345100_6:1020-418(-)